ncbi:hypothetical protein E5288_WYG008924 [Bos mutus]|uniref:Ig-like domain-containing protein n=1 Tax=Bos mutus TaxID=72004 RepID=A0A6B0QSW5_9CETA|nr:hypothetical protein [Bos mutus]
MIAVVGLGKTITAGLGLSKVEQAQISLSTEVKKSINIRCKIESTNFESETVYWYWQKKNQALEHLIYVTSTTTAARNQVDGKNKIEARKDAQMFTSTLTVNFIEKEDVGIYYCAGWSSRFSSFHSKPNCSKLHDMYVSLIILFNSLPFPPTDRRLDGDLFPKPTVFFPSVEEVKLHGAGTHLCLLQNFFPDAIKIQWKEKNVNTILESYQGNIIKTNDTYMKFSWLTLTKKAMDKEHVCIVKHENNKGGRDQQILFSPVKKDKYNSHIKFYIVKNKGRYTCLHEKRKWWKKQNVWILQKWTE